MSSYIVAQDSVGDADSVAVGWVLGPHGTLGEVRVRVFSDVPFRFDPGQGLCCDGSLYQIAESRRQGSNQVVLKLDGIDSASAAQKLSGQWLTAPSDTSPRLPEGEYFHFQLLGLRVITDDGEELGEVTEIIETGSNDVYVVLGENGQVLIPAISQVVRKVDLAEGVITVKLLDGLR